MLIQLLNRANAGSITISNTNNTGTFSLVVLTATDQIKAQLSTSLAAYNAAAVNDWVKITSTEYTNIANNIPGATKKGEESH